MREFVADTDRRGDDSARVLPTRAEIAAQGPDVDDCIRTAISGLWLGADPSMNAGKTLARSERFWDAVGQLNANSSSAYVVMPAGQKTRQKRS